MYFKNGIYPGIFTQSYDVPIPSPVKTIRTVGDVTYGFSGEYDYTYYYRLYGQIYANIGMTFDATTAIVLGGVSNFTGSQTYALYYQVDQDVQFYSKLIENGVSPISTTNLNGKYRINKLKLPGDYLDIPVQDNLSSGFANITAPILIDFTIDNVLYRCFSLITQGTYKVNNVRVARFRTIRLYERETGNYTDYTLTQFAEQFDRSIITFNNSEIPTELSEWLTSFLDVVYEGTFTVKSQTGEVLTSAVELPPITSIFISTISNLVKVTLTDITNTQHELEWLTAEPQGEKFAGLSYEANSDTIDLQIGDNDVTIDGNTVMYEVFVLYDPITQPFDIYLYQNTAEPNRVDKTDYLTDVLQLHGVLRDECSLIAPSIIFESSAYLQFNYVYIPAFGRYYFVLGIDSVSKNLWRMRLNCDVLMSYKENIWLLDAVIDRQENDFNPLLNDPNVPAQTNRNIEVIEMGSLDVIGGGTFDVQDIPDFSRRCDYVLLTVGEGASTE